MSAAGTRGRFRGGSLPRRAARGSSCWSRRPRWQRVWKSPGWWPWWRSRHAAARRPLPGPLRRCSASKPSSGRTPPVPGWPSAAAAGIRWSSRFATAQSAGMPVGTGRSGRPRGGRGRRALPRLVRGPLAREPWARDRWSSSASPLRNARWEGSFDIALPVAPWAARLARGGGPVLGALNVAIRGLLDPRHRRHAII